MVLVGLVFSMCYRASQVKYSIKSICSLQKRSLYKRDILQSRCVPFLSLSQSIEEGKKCLAFFYTTIEIYHRRALLEYNLLLNTFVY